MRVTTVKDWEEFQVDVGELSGLASRLRSGVQQLIAVGDESADLHVIHLADTAVEGVASLPTSYPAPRSGSNFEGVAADDQGNVVVVTERPPGVLILDEHSFTGDRYAAHWCVRFDEATVRERSGMAPDQPLQPEGVLLLRNGHLLVAHEKDPIGLIEFGPPGDEPLGIHPSSYLEASEGFTARPPRLAALAWWSVTGGIEDVSDIAAWEGDLYLVSDQSRLIVRVAVKDLVPGDEVELDRGWRLPDKFANPEGLTFAGSGELYVGLDIDLTDRPKKRSLLRLPPLPD